METGIIKVIIANDRELIRKGVIQYLQKYNDIQFIGEAENGKELLEKMEYLLPDVILLNIQMPVMDGIKAMPLLKSLYPAVKIIIFSIHTDPSVIRRMLELGASSYLTMDCSKSEMHDAIVACHKNWFYITDAIRMAILNSWEPVNKLSEKEFAVTELKILQLIKDKVPVREIAVVVGLSILTTNLLIRYMKDKVKVETNEHLIQYVLDKKYIV